MNMQPISPRARAVARHLVQGYGREGTAAELGISLGTMGHYFKEIRKATGHKTLYGAVAAILLSHENLCYIMDVSKK